MSDIDPEKLEQAIKASYVSAQGGVGLRTTVSVYIDEYETLCEAARAHLATLPRFKEVEFERWGIITSTGEYVVTFNSEANARRECPSDHHVVRLTGTAKVKVA